MRVIDIIRSGYVRAPHWLRAATAPVLGRVPPAARYGYRYVKLCREIKRSEVDSVFVADAQSIALSKLIEFAVKGSPFYRNKFNKVLGRRALSVYDVFDIYKELPVLKKNEIRSSPLDLIVKPEWQVEMASTSGTSGRPFVFFLDRDRSVREWAFIHHIWGRVGFDPNCRRAVFRGIQLNNVDIQPWRYDSALRELQLSPFHLNERTMDEYLKAIDEYEIRYIQGYPSALTILARHIDRVGWMPKINFKAIFPISERMTYEQRKLVRRAFCTEDILAFYGLSEKVAIGGEKPNEPDLYEFEPLYGVTELLDESGVELKMCGERGSLVATGFISTGMPFIRYDTGDTAELVEIPSEKNCYRLRVKNIRSRWAQEFIVSKDGALISIAALNIHSDAYAAIHSFQFFQENPGLVVVRVVPVAGAGYEHANRFVQEIQKKVGSRVRFECELRKEIPTNARGKRLMIDQKLDIATGDRMAGE